MDGQMVTPMKIGGKRSTAVISADLKIIFVENGGGGRFLPSQTSLPFTSRINALRAFATRRFRVRRITGEERS